MNTQKILLYEPDNTLGSKIKSHLEKEGYDVVWIHDFYTAQRSIVDKEYTASLVQIDGKRGLELIKDWFSKGTKPLCISLYRKENTSAGFEASKLGSQAIYDVESRNNATLDELLRKYSVEAKMPHPFVHTTESYLTAIQDLHSLINHGKPALLTGESGCGKSYLAEHVHHDGTSGDFQYEEVKCGDLDTEYANELLLGVVRNYRSDIKRDKKGVLDMANERDLLYLEHLQDLPPELQETLATIIEKRTFRSVGSTKDKPFTAIVIASCNSMDDINRGQICNKLFTVISHNEVKVPPLRMCLGDIIPNAEQIIQDFCTSNNRDNIPVLAVDAQIKLFAHTWPGNYRELKNCVETAAARNVSGTIEASELMITLAENESEIPTSERELIIHFMVMYKGRKKR